MNKQNRDLVDAQDRAKRQKDFKINPTQGETYGDKELDDLKKYGKVERDSHIKSSNKLDLDEYEVQYDPNNDFAIFGIGDQTRGGIQTLKEKMNLADDDQKGNEDSSSDEDNSVQRKNSKLSTQGVTNMQMSSRGASGASSQDTAAKMANHENSDENDLPEDKEIHSENEEEEE